ncbi:MAG TPA: short-chain dehydrogenase/reductase [Burkholderiales bacterium]|jgi:NAD(P)-dependent dehydrogenase (short-subunit alcohol dehydrogenase family)
MDMGLKGKNVLITGASKGIGLACAKAFAAEGANLHLAARDPARLEAAKAEIAKVASVQVTLHPSDLGRGEVAKSLAAACGAIDVLVNNAGAIPGGNIEAVDEARWRDAWDLKVFGYINMTREVLPAMMKRGSGVIINVIGLAGMKPSMDYICGATGNAALIAFTKGVGGSSTSKGVRVLGVNPTATRTDRIITLSKAKAKSAFGDESRWEEILSNSPFGRICEPEEVADVVLYCASARASYLSGTVIDIDGGQLYRG